MQDRYVGDVGDFGKYGLLDFISSETKLKLGVNWCLTSPTQKRKNLMTVSFMIIYYQAQNMKQKVKYPRSILKE
jgi:hypothetical protein